jgi:nucleoside-diphosphate-sugar epimerase
VRNGRPIRDFVWLNDVVQALTLLVSDRIPGVFNVGTGVGVSISELAQIFLGVVGGQHRDVDSLNASPDYSYNVVSVDKIKRKLGWEPTVTISESVNNLVNAI